MSDHIPFEVQGEIMKLYPTKSLMQFRSVSKSWKTLIDSPKFIADYSFNHTHQQHLFVSYDLKESHEQKYVSFIDDDTFPLEKVSLPDPIPGLIRSECFILGLIMPTIIGSSQGLFCIYNFNREPRHHILISRRLHLWNPSIRKSVAIDVSHVVVPGSHISIGFGVCPHTRDPKVVKINTFYTFSDVGTISCTPWQVEIYTLSSRGWRSIPTINQPRNSVGLSPCQVAINEFIYWLAIDGTYLNIRNVIVSFDFTSERFMEVSLPDTLARASEENLVISKLKESLVLVEVVGAWKPVYGVWMMEHGVSNSFTKLFSINSPDASIQEVLGVWKTSEPIFAMKTNYNVDDVFVHELFSERIKYLGISGNGSSYCAHSYMETLLLLGH